MKIKSLLLAVCLLTGILAKADEGMWLPALINKNYDDMKKLGFKLSAQDVYDVNNASMKDAIVSLGFCTGEIVSAEGLMLTNHHCGYSTIQYHSAVDHDYLTDGFVAKTREEELPSQEVTASMLQRIEDVTPMILKAIAGLNESERAAKIKEVSKTITDSVTKGNSYTATIKDIFGGNQYILFIYEKYTDVRLVFAPPSSVGKFGGDTDNWMWPRHTGDFSVFRIYMSKDGKPAPYSKDNVPYKPKKFLPVSLKGVNPGDYTMIMGYPGRTNRYAFSRELQNAVDRVNPAIVELMGKRLEVMKADMDKDPAVRIKIADTYASLANSWKYYIGQTEGLKKLDVIGYKKAEEARFTSFANSADSLKGKYAGVLSDIDVTFGNYKPYVLNSVYLNIAAYASVSSNYAASFQGLYAALKGGNSDAIAAAVKQLNEGLAEHFKDYAAVTDKKLLGELLILYNKNLAADQKAPYIKDLIEMYPAANADEALRKFAEDASKRSMFFSKEKTEAFLAAPDMAKLEADPLFAYILKMEEFRKSYAEASTAYNNALAKDKRAYIAGLMEMSPMKKFYPDANSTMRLTYGQIKEYAPKDGLTYNHITTSEGILEKYKPGDQEFDVPVKLVDLLKKKDFGSYALSNGKLPVAFLSDNDITGGNSGSPVINANGELIGIAFDGNWEAMTGDLVFDKGLKRTISVDIRYVLFIMEKYMDGGHLVKEMEIRK